ncbi:Mitotic checkpoint serine/threonine-protein kinase [Dirofilaria immitis]
MEVKKSGYTKNRSLVAENNAIGNNCPKTVIASTKLQGADCDRQQQIKLENEIDFDVISHIYRLIPVFLQTYLHKEETLLVGKRQKQRPALRTKISQKHKNRGTEVRKRPRSGTFGLVPWLLDRLHRVYIGLLSSC